jgi:hypothetical protein
LEIGVVAGIKEVAWLARSTATLGRRGIPLAEELSGKLPR